MDALLWPGVGLAIFIGSLAAIIGLIGTIVVAFRQSVLWGLVCLFIPFGVLVFAVLHWAEARKSVLVTIVSALIVFGGVMVLPSGKVDSWRSGSSPQRPAELTAEIQEKRDRIYHLETVFAEASPRLTKQFQELEARRQALNVSDAAAVNEFNTAAAAYQQENAFRKAMLQEIEAERARLDELLAERSRTAAAPNVATPGSHRVVIYSADWCPACRTAKQYMAQRGIPYDERDVDKSPADRAEFQRLGGRGIPLILVGDKRMEGFNPTTFEAML